MALYIQDAEGSPLAAILRRAGLDCSSSIDSSRIVLSVVTEPWLGSDASLNEALEARRTGQAWLVRIAVADEGALTPSARARLHEVRREGRGIDEAASDAQLIADLYALGADPERGPEPAAFAVDRASCPEPFLGRAEFGPTDAHAALFCGRGREITEVLSILRARRLAADPRPLLITGRPGVGKTSFVAAGLVPRLLREGQAWRALFVRPGHDPVLSFAQGIASRLSDEEPYVLRERLVAAWRSDLIESRLSEVAGRLTEGETGTTILLVVDPEEVDEGPQSDVFDAYLAAAAAPKWRVLLVGRPEWYRDLQPECYKLRPIPAFRLDEVLTGPAERYGARVEPELAWSLIEDTRGRPSLNEIGTALLELWRRASPNLSLASYEEAGRIEGLLRAASDREQAPRRSARRRLAWVLGMVLGVLAIAPLLTEQWRYWTLERPTRAQHFDPFVLNREEERALQPGDMFQECTHCPSMVVVPAGRFMMGDERQEMQSALPIHEVAIPRPFAVGRTEVTIEEGRFSFRVNGFGPYAAGAMGTKPAVHVSLSSALLYVAWLRRMTGRPYRLLSEAEWEYVARAGTDSAFSWGESPAIGRAHCIDCGSPFAGDIEVLPNGIAIASAPVASFEPNPFGLFDMHGNVAEWVRDCWHQDYLGAPQDGRAWGRGDAEDCAFGVVRGGSLSGSAYSIRSALRRRETKETASLQLGFRVARDLNFDTPR